MRANDASLPGAQPVCPATTSGLSGNSLKGSKGLRSALEKAFDHVKICSTFSLPGKWNKALHLIDKRWTV